MAKSKLFQAAVLFHPTEAEAKEGKKTEVLISPKDIVATDEKAAVFQVIREIDQKYADKFDQLEVIVRPF